MESGVPSIGWHDVVLAVDSWRQPESEWDVEVMLDLLASLPAEQVPEARVGAIIQRVASPHSVSEVDQVRVDAGGALRRPSGTTMDSELLGWVAACAWGESGIRDLLLEGHTAARFRADQGGACAHVCVPLRPDRSGQTLIACMIAAPSTDAARRLASRLTLLTHLITEPISGGDTAAESAGGAEAALTSRQREILRGMAQGMTNRQIATRIAFSESTVRLESMAIYRLFGVHSRFQAVAAAREAGLLRGPVLPVGA